MMREIRNDFKTLIYTFHVIYQETFVYPYLSSWLCFFAYYRLGLSKKNVKWA